MSNYPPGVTGHEYAIAGPMDEYDSTRAVRIFEVCDSAPDAWFAVEGTITVYDRYSADFTFDCEHCKGSHTVPLPDSEEF